MNYEDFINDDKTKDAVIKNLIEIGEAANHIPDDIREKHSNHIPQIIKKINLTNITALFGCCYIY